MQNSGCEEQKRTPQLLIVANNVGVVALKQAIFNGWTWVKIPYSLK